MPTTATDKPMTETVLTTEILNVPEVARYLRISRAHGYALVRRGIIPCLSIGGSPRIRRTDLMKWIDGQSRLQ